MFFIIIALYLVSVLCLAQWSSVVVVVSINPINRYQEPNLSINKSHNFMI